MMTVAHSCVLCGQLLNPVVNISWDQTEHALGQLLTHDGCVRVAVIAGNMTPMHDAVTRPPMSLAVLQPVHA